MDGNRRFARKLNLKPWKGHEYGAEKVKELFKWCKDLNINELTLYTLSTENLKRTKKELNYLMNLFKKQAKEIKNNEDVHKNKIKIKFVGEKKLLDKKIQKLMKEIEDSTKNYSNYKINFAIPYGGRKEIIQAVKKLIKNNQKITEENIQKNLWVTSCPDLIIRTGGEKRTSNFLPWQSIYSEWIFLDKLWPEFTESDLKKSIKEFYNRQRRFGK